MAWIDLETGRPMNENELKQLKAKPAPKQAPTPAQAQAPVPASQDPAQVQDFSGAVGMLAEQAGGGAMASLKRTYLGLKQLATYMTGDDAAKQAVNDEIQRMEAEYGPILATPAGKVGEMAGVVGQFMVPGMVGGKLAKVMPKVAEAVRTVAGQPGSIGRAAATAGLFEGAQPVLPGTTSTGDLVIQRGVRTALGAGVGAIAGAIGNKLTRVGTPPIPQLQGIDKEAARVGFTGKAALTPAQRTGDPMLQQYEEGLLSLPGSSRVIRNIRKAQEDVLNKAAGKALGYPKMNPTESVFGMARDNANLAYEPIAQIGKLKTDVPYFDDLVNIARKTDSDVVAKMAEKIRNKGSLSGGAFLEKMQDVRDMAFHASRQGDKYTAKEFGKLNTVMEDFLERRLTDLAKKPGNVITTDTIQQFRDARLQHAVIRDLEKATDPVLGKVSPAKVMARQFARQRPGSAPSPTSAALQDVTDISRVMRKTMPYIGSSGTAERLAGQDMVNAELSPLASLQQAGPALKNYIAAKLYIRNGGQPGMLGAHLPPNVNALARRLFPPEMIAAGEAMAER